MRQQPINTLNDLSSKEWVKATKSWFIINPRPRTRNQFNHPAKFPEELVKHIVQFFTKTNAWVLDPFAGVGSTLIACNEMSRHSVGIELNHEFIDIGKKFLSLLSKEHECHLIEGDSRDITSLLEKQFNQNAPTFDFLITSPPYWDMLRKSRGGNNSVHNERKQKGLKQFYSDLKNDLGNIEDYVEYIETVASLLVRLKIVLRNDAYLAIIVQNMRDTDGVMRPIAWDLARRLSEDFILQQEMIWCQDNKKLGCWGYPTTYVSNVHHHYCLIFQNKT